MNVEDFERMLSKLNNVSKVELVKSSIYRGNLRHEFVLVFTEKGIEEEPEPPPDLGVDVKEEIGAEDIFGGA
jgi:hypothetical protein